MCSTLSLSAFLNQGPSEQMETCPRDPKWGAAQKGDVQVISSFQPHGSPLTGTTWVAIIKDFELPSDWKRQHLQHTQHPLALCGAIGSLPTQKSATYWIANVSPCSTEMSLTNLLTKHWPCPLLSFWWAQSTRWYVCEGRLTTQIVGCISHTKLLKTKGFVEHIPVGICSSPCSLLYPSNAH